MIRMPKLCEFVTKWKLSVHRENPRSFAKIVSVLNFVENKIYPVSSFSFDQFSMGYLSSILNILTSAYPFKIPMFLYWVTISLCREII